MVINVGFHFAYNLAQVSPPPTAKASSSHLVEESSTYVLHRVLSGVPEGIDDITPGEAFPMDSNLDIMGGGMSYFC